MPNVPTYLLANLGYLPFYIGPKYTYQPTCLPILHTFLPRPPTYLPQPLVVHLLIYVTNLTT
jgi:hypothetical protein